MGYVYKITHIASKKSYIGISTSEPEKGRIKEHLSGRGNRYLKNAVKKYGKDAFTYEILEANVFDEFLPDLEVAYIAKFNTIRPHGFNLTSGGEIAKTVSDETRRKISESLKNPPIERRRKYSEIAKNRKFSDSTRRKMSESSRGEKHPNFGKPLPESTRRKIAEAHKGKKLSPEHRQKIAEGGRGKKHTEATIQKLRELNTGENNPQFGKKASESTRKKMSEARSGAKNPRFHPQHLSVREYFFSLAPELPLTEKRRLTFDKFRDISRSTIYDWTQKWTSTS